MPIRRPRGPRPALRYLAFLEAMAAAGSEAELRRDLAAFATLRLLDHWIDQGAEMADREMLAHRMTRRAVRAMDRADPLRGLLEQVLRAIEMLLEPDAHSLGSRILAIGEHYESNGRFAEAAEVYATAARMIDSSVKVEWAFHAHLRRGFCMLVIGEHHWAEQEFARAGALSAMHRDRWGVLVARVALAKLELAREATRTSDRLMRALASEFESFVKADRGRPRRHR